MDVVGKRGLLSPPSLPPFEEVRNEYKRRGKEGVSINIGLTHSHCDSQSAKARSSWILEQREEKKKGGRVRPSNKQRVKGMPECSPSLLDPPFHLPLRKRASPPFWPLTRAVSAIYCTVVAMYTHNTPRTALQYNIVVQ